MRDQIYMGHPSRHMTPEDWQVWRDSAQGMLDILKYPVLGKMAPWQTFIKDVK